MTAPIMTGTSARSCSVTSARTTPASRARARSSVTTGTICAGVGPEGQTVPTAAAELSQAPVRGLHRRRRSGVLERRHLLAVPVHRRDDQRPIHHVRRALSARCRRPAPCPRHRRRGLLRTRREPGVPPRRPGDHRPTRYLHPHRARNPAWIPVRLRGRTRVQHPRTGWLRPRHQRTRHPGTPSRHASTGGVRAVGMARTRYPAPPCPLGRKHRPAMADPVSRRATPTTTRSLPS
jgi:hypothetical protein